MDTFTLNHTIRFTKSMEKRRIAPLDITLPALFAALTAVGALITIPMIPVPITLQTFFTLLSGAILGSRRAAFSQALYVAMGVAGLPIFSSFQSGPLVLIGPTGGYLIGFIVGAYAMGKIFEVKGKGGFKSWKERQKWLIISMITATVIIYSFGVAQLSLIIGSLETAIVVGMLPFLVGDAIKIFVVSIIASQRNIVMLSGRFLSHINN